MNLFDQLALTFSQDRLPGIIPNSGGQQVYIDPDIKRVLDAAKAQGTGAQTSSGQSWWEKTLRALIPPLQLLPVPNNNPDSASGGDFSPINPLGLGIVPEALQGDALKKNLSTVAIWAVIVGLVVAAVYLSKPGVSIKI